MFLSDTLGLSRGFEVKSRLLFAAASPSNPGGLFLIFRLFQEVLEIERKAYGNENDYQLDENSTARRFPLLRWRSRWGPLGIGNFFGDGRWGREKGYLLKGFLTAGQFPLNAVTL
jgi:hypothetical protein